MAINFPNNPSVGNTYDYAGVRYTYQATGFWAVTTPGTVGIATGQEIIDGVNNTKYITPLGMEESDYWNAGNDGAGSGLDADVVDGLEAAQFLRSDSDDDYEGNLTLHGTATSGSYQDAPVEIREVGLVGTAQTDINYGPKLAFHWAGRSERSIVLDSSGVLHTRQGTTNKKILDAGNVVSSDLGQTLLKSANGYIKLTGGLIIQWGKTATINYDTEGTTFFPIAFPNVCASINYSIVGANSGDYQPRISYTANNAFKIVGHGITTPYFWMAIGY